MRMRRSIVVCGGFLAGAAAALPVRADVYTWVDRNGTVTVTNVAPPEGARVTGVVRADEVAKAVARRPPDAAQLQALNERVQQLEQQLQAATAPPPVVYPPIAATARYVAAAPAPVVSYAPEPAPLPTAYGCDPAWTTCWPALAPPIYPAAVVVLNAANGRHFHSSRGGHRHGGARQRGAPGLRHHPR
jgi:hypothetical protein